MVELSPVAKAALGQLLSAISAQAREWFKKTAVERAADRLVGTHRHGQDLKRALAAWFTRPQFRTALFRIQQGGGEVDRNALADALIDAGFGKRIMFGSDQMVWPGVIEPAIAIIEEAPFLTAEQKRDIFYNNAARFLRLSEDEISKHHHRSL